MKVFLFQKLRQQGLISSSSFKKIAVQQQEQLFSVHWEIRTILYLGILLLTGGLGILVYKNIDTLGHQVILLFIALVCAGSFFYCFRTKLSFSVGKVKAPNAFFDYILLLGCLTFLIFIAYFQYRYNVFGERYGLATFVPMIVLFFSAYYFDHLGILSLAITNLAAWAGVTVTPWRILQSNDFSNSNLILTGVILGTFLIVCGILSAHKKIKAHFEFTYTNFGMHILFISVLAAMFHFDKIYMLWFVFLIAAAFYFYSSATKQKSFYIVLVSTLYFYTGLSYMVINFLSHMAYADLVPVYIGFIYFIASGITLVIFLLRTNKTLKHDSIQ